MSNRHAARRRAADHPLAQWALGNSAPTPSPPTRRPSRSSASARPVRDEHYVKVDFHGWRYFELLLRERDAESCGDYVWPYGTEDHYAIYRSPLVRRHVSGLNLYFNDLPAQAEATCYFSQIKALKAVKVKLRNPAVQIGGRRIAFPGTLESGAYLELNSASDCKHYDERGTLLEEVKPQGDIPLLAAGDIPVRFACEGP